MSKSVICLDLDGTLLDKNELIHPNDINFLSSRRYSNYIISTGRALPGIKGVFNLNGLFIGEKIPFPIVSQNGAVLYGPGEKLLEFNSFEAEIQDNLIKHIGIFPEIPFFLFGENEVFLKNPNQLGLHYASIWFYALANTKDERFPALSKVMGLSRNTDLLKEVANSIQHLKIETSFSLEFLLELTPSGINKGWGLKRLLSIQNWGNGIVIYAGDGGNDIPGFEISQLSFAPLTASDFVKAKADHVIDTEGTGLLSQIHQEAGII